MEIKTHSDVHKYVVTSSISKDNFDIVKKYNPDALKLFDEDGNVTFAISFNPERSSVSKVGVTFGQKNEEGFLQAVGDIMASEAQSSKDFVADVIAPAYEHLRKLENQVNDAAREAMESHTSLVNTIVEG